MEPLFKNNQAVLAGEAVSEFQFSHEVFGEGFYLLYLKVARLSEAGDVVPLLVSDRLINVHESILGKQLEAKGQFRSYNKHEENQNHLILSLFVREIRFLDEGEKSQKPNSIYLDGFICKPPVYRMTPLGREIADLLVAVNRAYGKSDYIPCIAWGRNARFVKNLQVGDRIALSGRIQSREYQKKIGEYEVRTMTAYEVSVSKLAAFDSAENFDLEREFTLYTGANAPDRTDAAT